MDEMAALATVVGMLRAAASADPAVRTDDEACAWVAAVEEAGRLLDALRVAAATEVAHRSRTELGETALARRHGCRTASQLLERVTRVAAREATRRIRVGSRVAARSTLDGAPLPAEYPRVAAAFAEGAIGVDAVATITGCLAPAAERCTVADLDAAEEHLVAVARTEPADLVAIHARMWRDALDPDGTEPREERLRARREFRIGREIDGMTPFSGWADPVRAAFLRVAIGERTAPDRLPRFVDPDDPDVDVEAPAPVDNRSRVQRSFDALFGLLEAGVRADSATAGPLHSTATVNVVVSLADLRAGTGSAFVSDIAEPISAATANEIACDAGIRLHVVGERGEPLWLGMRERYFSAAQRRALAVRDGGCVWPQCGAPPSWCHAHHVVPYSDGGATDIDNGALLCAYHHHLLHRGEYRMRMERGIPHLSSPRWIDRDRRWHPVGAASVQRPRIPMRT